MCIRIVIIFFVYLKVQLIQSDWVEIPQISTADRYVLPVPSPLDIRSSALKATPISPIKYEDLEHIIGPGFEEELEKFYEKHKKELDEKERVEGVVKHSKVPPTPEDPWRIYDKPEHILRKTVTSTPATRKMNSAQHLNQHDFPIKEPPTGNTNVDHENYRNTSIRKEESDRLPFSMTGTKKDDKVDNKIATTPKSIVKIVKFKVKPIAEPPLSFAKFLEFLKDIQNTFMTNTARSIQDKIKMLETFKDDLLINIESRIKSLWPVTPVVRIKRSYLDSHGGGMDFPSAEGALMTISFLTFAVFLIKLVLQVINTIKSKHYSYNSFDTINSQSPMTAMTVIKRNRNARKISFPENHLNDGFIGIFNAINNFNDVTGGKV